MNIYLRTTFYLGLFLRFNLHSVECVFHVFCAHRRPIDRRTKRTTTQLGRKHLLTLTEVQCFAGFDFASLGTMQLYRLLSVHEFIEPLTQRFSTRIQVGLQATIMQCRGISQAA